MMIKSGPKRLCNIIWSMAQWVEEGEKNTSYFLRLEKHNYCKKLITKLHVNGKEITDPSEILKAGQNVYATLCKGSNDNKYVTSNGS